MSEQFTSEHLVTVDMWAPVHKFISPEGIGASLLKKDLVDRVRPVTFFTHPLLSIARSKSISRNKQHIPKGVISVHDFLQLKPPDDNDKFQMISNKILESIESELRTLPHMRLLRQIWPGVAGKDLSAQTEAQIVHIVHDALDLLSTEDQTIIKKAYGLQTWVPIGSPDIASSLGYTTGEVTGSLRRSVTFFDRLARDNTNTDFRAEAFREIANLLR